MRADARRNYERLLREAGAAFAERGADDVSLEEIARRSCVGIGTLYRHFPTRQVLLEAVYRDQVETLARQAADFLSWESAGEALHAWLRAMMAFGVTKKSLNKALLETIGKQSELLTSSGLVLRQCTPRVAGAGPAGRGRARRRAGHRPAPAGPRHDARLRLLAERPRAARADAGHGPGGPDARAADGPATAPSEAPAAR